MAGADDNLPPDDGLIPNSSPPPMQTPEHGGQRYDGPLPSGMPNPVPGRPLERRPAPPLETA
jgi:hypothetical protein